MRTGGRKRGVARPMLCLRWLIGFSFIAVPAVLSPLVPDGDNWAGVVSRHIVPRAEARKAHAAVASLRRSAMRPPVAAFKPPVFVLPKRQTERPPAGAFKTPALSPPRQGRVARFPVKTYKAPAVRPPRPAWRPPGKSDEGKGGRLDASKYGTRLPAFGGDGPTRYAAAEPGNDLFAPSRVARGHDARRHATFHRILGRLSKRSDRLKRELTPADAPAKQDKGVETGARGAKQAGRRLGSRPVAGLLPPIGSFRPDEVLAINLGPEGLAKVRAGSYGLAGTIELPEFGLTITRLKPPQNLNAISAWERLYDLLPEGSFALNRVFAPYRLGSGPGRAAAPVRSAHHDGHGCAADRCFGMALINWQTRLAACARDVRIGVVDTGFDKSHPAFAGLRYEYREFLPEGSARASDQHGTGVLSLLAGNPGSGTPGLIPDAHYVFANAFFADSSGQPVSDTAQMLQALHWLKKSGVAVANLSFAGPEDELLHHGVRQLTKAGIVVVAAAGNDGPSAPPSYPAAYEEVIAVTAVDRNLAAYRYASRGDHIDVAAPGVDVWTAFPGRREGPQTGTSFAVPYVTAIVAVAHSAGGLRPGDDPLAAKARALTLLRKGIKGLGDHGRDPTFGAGLVQAPALCDAIAPTAVAAAEPWAGTVRRVFDAEEPFVVGAWTNTVRAASGD